MSKRVLVADDDDATRRLISEALTDAGYECVPARDGVEALRLARASPPDAIVLDAVMPYASGDEVQRALRGGLATRYVPVIFVSGQRTSEQKARRILEGADDYLTKPFDIDELVARITNAVRRSSELRALNPLSGLPGNLAISAALTRALAGGGAACLYCDLDRFKDYNDHYGFARGDDLIVLLARLLTSVAERLGPDAFLGHVGGDDFVLVVREDIAEDTARIVVSEFDAVVPSVYDREDRDRGYIVSADRSGIDRTVPLVSVSLGIVPITRTRFADAVAVSRAATEVKEIAKRRPGSSWAIDRRRAAEPLPSIPVA
jgi:diguanylate cyclase (GGDEF)-like protein